MVNSNSDSRPKRLRIMRWVCLVLVFAAILIGNLFYRRMADPERVRRIAQEYLEKITNQEVVITSASFSFRDGVHLRGVAITNQPPETGVTAPKKPGAEVFFSCPEISIMHDSWALMFGKLRFESFAANRPTLTLVHDSETGWVGLSSLMRNIISDQGPKSEAPPVELRQARLRIVDRSPAGDRLVEDLQLTVRGRRAVDNPRIFNIVWQDAVDPDANGHSQIDLKTGELRNVSGGLPTMSVRGIMVAVDAGFDGADALTDLLGIEGRVRIRDYNLMTPPLHEGPRSATIDLRDAAISIPISENERDLDANDRYLKFNGVHGSIVITASSIQADFRGLFHRARCDVSALITGPLKPGITLADVSVRADFSAESLPLPDPAGTEQEKRFIQAWPQVSRLFQQYDPHGMVDLDVNIEKAAGARENFRVQDARITARGGDVSCHFFPYRGTELTGEIRFGADGVIVQNICGIHDTARVCVNGWMEEPSRSAAARFDVIGKSVPIDDELLTSLRPHQRRWIDDHQIEGTFGATLALTRSRSAEPGGTSPWKSTISLSYQDLTARFAQAPVRMTHVAGTAQIRDDLIEIPYALGRIGDGSVTIAGHADTHENGLDHLAIRVLADDLAIDEELLAAIPAEFRDKAAMLRADGCVAIESDVDFDAVEGLRHNTLVRIRNLAFTPVNFPLPISRAWADLRVDNENFELLRARGYYRNCEIFAKGNSKLDFSGDGEWVVEADALPIDQTFREAAPAALSAALSDWALDKPISTQVRFRNRDHSLTWNGRAELHDTTLQHRRMINPLDSVFATVFFNNDEIRCTQARAHYGNASIDADFVAAIASSPVSGRLRVDIKGLELDAYSRSLLPAAGQRIWDSLSPAGRVDFTLDELQFQSADPPQPMIWSVDGRLYPRDVRLGENRAIIGSGMIPFEGMLVDRLGGMTLSGELRDADLTLFDQKVSGANASWYFARTATGQGRAALAALRGQVHGGSASSDAQLTFNGTQAEYRVESSIQAAQLAPWIEAWRAARGEVESATPNRLGRRQAEEVRGTLNAEINVAGVLNNPGTRTGGGRMEVRDGYIYKLPIFMAILNVLNINVPSQDVLSEAESQFFITGNTVQLTSIAVLGESLSLVGSGTLSLTDNSVDLTLMNAGGGRLAGVPVLAELWEGASRELVEIRVTGPISHPQVRASPFRGVTEEFKKLFQKRKPRRNAQAEGS